MPRAQPDLPDNSDKWQVVVLPPMNGGINTSEPRHLIPDNETPWSSNVVDRKGVVSVDRGYAPLGLDQYNIVPINITAITRASTAVVTAVYHKFSNGNTVKIVDVDGMTQVNNLTFTVASVTQDTFQLSGINSTSYGEYSGPSGTVVLVQSLGNNSFEVDPIQNDTLRETTAVKVSHTTHGLQSGDIAVFEGVDAITTLIPADRLNTVHEVTDIIDANNYRVTVRYADLPTTIVSGGGNTTTYTYTKYQDLFGTIKGFFTHIIPASGSQIHICVTSETVYWLNNDSEWDIVSNNVTDSIASSAVGGGASSVEVADVTGFVDGSVISISDDGTKQHQARITGIVSTTISFSPSTPTGFNAAVGKIVTQGPKFNVSDADMVKQKQVVFAAFPSQGLTVFTNGIDTPQKFDGTNCVDVGGLASVSGGVIRTCDTLVTYKDYLILGNVNQNGTRKPYMLVWCDTGDAGDWNTGNASAISLFDTRDPIVAMQPLGNDLIIYKTRSMTRLEWVGLEDKLFNVRTIVFGIQIGASGLGAISANSVFPVRLGHVFLSNNGIYLYIGGDQIQDIGQKIFYGVFDAGGELEKSIAERSFVQYNEEDDEVYFFYPSVLATTYCDRAIVYDLNKLTFRRKEFKREFTCAGTKVTTQEFTYNDLTGDCISQEWSAVSISVQGEVPTISLGGLSGSDFTNNKSYDYNYVAASEAGFPVEWSVDSKALRVAYEFMRFDRFDSIVSGDGITVSYTVDGTNWTVLSDSICPGPLRTTSRLYKQFISDQVALRFSGKGGGPEVLDIAFRFRRESRWGYE